MSNFVARLGRVVTVESVNDKDYANGLRIKVNLESPTSGQPEKLPWCFPLMPKVFQSVPKKDECVLVLSDEAVALLKYGQQKPLPAIPKGSTTAGAFPESTDVAVVGRGTEDIILRNRKDKTSEVDIRAGIRNNAKIDGEKSVGNIIFNNEDPAYIQLKFKKGLVTGDKKDANSIINMVADRINIMSNRDDNVNQNIHDSGSLVKEEKMGEIMNNLHQVPMGDKLVELLKIMKGAIMHHVHPWAGMEQCGDWPGYIKKLDGYDIDSILSEYVRIS